MMRSIPKLGMLACTAVLQDELLLAAATEFAIYNAQRHLLPARSPIRAVHAPARRIARTMVCLGRQVGKLAWVLFGCGRGTTTQLVLRRLVA
jgi:hypothetical protein